MGRSAESFRKIAHKRTSSDDTTNRMDSMQTAAWRQPGVPSCTWSWENTSAFRVSFRPGSSKFSPRREAKNESRTWMATGNGFRERVPNLTQVGISNCRSMPRQEPVQVVEPFTEFCAKGTDASKIGDCFPDPVSLTPFPAGRPVGALSLQNTVANQNRPPRFWKRGVSDNVHAAVAWDIYPNRKAA